MHGFLDDKTHPGGDLMFIASQIMYNIDEMIDLMPSQQWEKIEMGWGSKAAIVWIRSGLEQHDNMNILKEIKQGLQKLSLTQLYCLGLEIENEDGEPALVWALNHRQVGLHDMEHFLCKLWLVMVRVIGARPGKNPRLHRPHVHPLKMDEQKVRSFYCKSLINIAEKSVSLFKRGETDERNNDTLCVPCCFTRW